MYVITHNNDADFLTKLLPPGDKIKDFIRNINHPIFGIMSAALCE